MHFRPWPPLPALKSKNLCAQVDAMIQEVERAQAQFDTAGLGAARAAALVLSMEE